MPERAIKKTAVRELGGGAGDRENTDELQEEGHSIPALCEYGVGAHQAVC